jgi:hypothetical protein
MGERRHYLGVAHGRPWKSWCAFSWFGDLGIGARASRLVWGTCGLSAEARNYRHSHPGGSGDPRSYKTHQITKFRRARHSHRSRPRVPAVVATQAEKAQRCDLTAGAGRDRLPCRAYSVSSVYSMYPCFRSHVLKAVLPLNPVYSSKRAPAEMTVQSRGTQCSASQPSADAFYQG